MTAQSRDRSESMKCFNEMVEQGPFWVVGPKPEEGPLLVHMTPWQQSAWCTWGSPLVDEVTN